jgi:hypothetical protein
MIYAKQSLYIECSFCRLIRRPEHLIGKRVGISRQTEGLSFGGHLINESVSVTPSSVTEASIVLCSVSLWLVWVSVQSACALNTRYIWNWLIFRFLNCIKEFLKLGLCRNTLPGCFLLLSWHNSGINTTCFGILGPSSVTVALFSICYSSLVTPRTLLCTLRPQLTRLIRSEGFRISRNRLSPTLLKYDVFLTCAVHSFIWIVNDKKCLCNKYLAQYILIYKSCVSGRL